MVITHILYKRGFDFVQVLVQVFILNFGLLIAKVLVVFIRHRKYHAKKLIYLKLNVHNHSACFFLLGMVSF